MKLHRAFKSVAPVVLLAVAVAAATAAPSSLACEDEVDIGKGMVCNSLISAKTHTEQETSGQERPARFLVGNGPLAEADRQLVSGAPAERIYRFNGMSNLLDEEKVGNVFAKNMGTHTTGGYWGLHCCGGKGSNLCHVEQAGQNMCTRIMEAIGVILLGGAGSKSNATIHACTDAVKISSHVPDVIDSSTAPDLSYVVELDGEKHVAGMDGWSSGFLGFSYLRRMFPGDDIHIVGMNWGAGLTGYRHPFPRELELIKKVTDVAVHIHETPSQTYHDHDSNVCICSKAVLNETAGTAGPPKRLLDGRIGVCGGGDVVLSARGQLRKSAGRWAEALI